MTFDIKTSSIALSASTMVITYADTPKTLTVTPANANVNWTSSNPSVVKVEGGKVTPVSVGSADITATLVSNPNVKATCKITVRAMPITRATVTLDREQLDYDGLEQAVHVTGVVVNGITLTSDDYEVSGDRGTDPGPYTVTVTGKGNYSGTAQASWSIVDNTAPEQPSTEQPVMSETEPAPAETQKEKITPASIELSSQFKVTNSGNVVTVKYGRVTGADSYVICASYCETKKCVKLGEVNRTKYSFSKLNKKKLDLTRTIKLYVIAMQKGKELARTKTIHMALRKHAKYTNIKKLYLSQSSARLKVGKTKKVSTRVILEDGSKKELPLSEHNCERFTYASSDKSVATVTNKGKIKAVGKGTCNIWVYAMNGTAKKMKVTVT
jgi:hypothetical protein